MYHVFFIFIFILHFTLLINLSLFHFILLLPVIHLTHVRSIPYSLDSQEQVTTIGRAVSLLPLDPRIGRIILLGCICGCGPSVLATSAAMGYR